MSLLIISIDATMSTIRQRIVSASIYLFIYLFLLRCVIAVWQPSALRQMNATGTFLVSMER